MERIAKRERRKYRDVIEGMLNAYRATPHPATRKIRTSSCLRERCDLEYYQRSWKHPSLEMTQKFDKMMRCTS